MKNLASSKTVKYIYYYLKIMIVFIPISALIVFGIIVNDFLRKGKLTGKWTFFSSNIIETPKINVFSDFADGVIILLLTFVVYMICVFIGVVILKFIRNVTEDKLLTEENGTQLKIIGISIVVLIIILTVTDVFRNLGGLTISNHVSFLTHLWIMLFGSLMVIFHPTFIIGLFFIVIGEILVKASLVKQENDLTV